MWNEFMEWVDEWDISSKTLLIAHITASMTVSRIITKYKHTAILAVI